MKNYPFYCHKCTTKFPTEKGFYVNSRNGMKFCVQCCENLKSSYPQLAHEWIFDDGKPEEKRDEDNYEYDDCGCGCDR